jgi:hypothetical protein
LPRTQLVNIVKIEPLKKKNAVRFLQSFDKTGEMFGNIPQEELLKHRLFEQPLTNQQVVDIYMLAKSDKTLDQISEIFDLQRQSV